MVTNNPSLSENHVVTPPQITTHPDSNKRINLPLILSVLILILAAGGGGYYLGKQSSSPLLTTNTNSKIQAPTSTPSSITQLTLTQTPISTQISLEPDQVNTVTKNLMVSYEHPTLHYTLEYPETWNAETEAKSSIKDYETLTIESPDYYHEYVLKKGVGFWIMADKTTITSIDDIKCSRSASVCQKIINSQKETVIDGVRAIQYDDSKEEVNATITQFIKNNKMYRIIYNYPDDNWKQSEWDTYINLLNSFKIK